MAVGMLEFIICLDVTDLMKEAVVLPTDNLNPRKVKFAPWRRRLHPRPSRLINQPLSYEKVYVHTFTTNSQLTFPKLFSFLSVFKDFTGFKILSSVVDVETVRWLSRSKSLLLLSCLS